MYSKVERSFNSDRTVAAKRFPESSKESWPLVIFADDWMIAFASLASYRPEIGVLLCVVVDLCFFYLAPVYVNIPAVFQA